MFNSVLVANRGEIACRVIRTVRRLGMTAVAIHTPAERGAPHVRAADQAIGLDSYLDLTGVIAAAAQTGAQAIHPGYGFLSENPALPRACAEAGIAFVGPGPEAMAVMGDKVAAKQAAQRAGVPVVDGLTVEEARVAGSDVYPLLVKAAAGGGGRGMRVVGAPDELDAALAAAAREARAGFGDDRVFIERFIPRARHLEVQVIADTHDTVLWLGERECSLQRRHQKILEEAPSPAVSPALRARLGQEAVALTRAAGYVNAGTVEFIADADDPSQHWFLEMNARLQVEHPVTEAVTGLDLVELQLRVAAGQPLGLSQPDIACHGHAVEVRITAEDPERDFLPATGRVLRYERPEGAGIRVDDGIDNGTVIDTAHDSLLAKVIAHAEDRDQALARLERALAHTTILGVRTTTAYLRGLVADPDVLAGATDTGLVARRGVPGAPIDDIGVATATAMCALARRAAGAGDEPWARVDGWRAGPARAGSHWRLAVAGGEPLDIDLPAELAATVTPTGDGGWLIAQRGRWTLAGDDDRGDWWIGHGGWAWPVARATSARVSQGSAAGLLVAPLPGQVLMVTVGTGDAVTAGQAVVVIESMKMELTVTAPFDGTVTELTATVGDRVMLDQPLARIEP